METSYFGIIGVLFACYQANRVLCFLWMMFRCYFLTTIGFVEDITKYGEWAVVTGASDGIGKEYARQLAGKGVKIVLISRSLEKLEKVAKEIEEDFHIETKIVCFDFSQTVGYEEIEKELSELDIGILVNNVGTVDAVGELFTARDVNNLTGLVNCNIMSEIRMSHMIMKGMLKRKWGVVIHMSSAVIYFQPTHALPTYPASKEFVARFCRSLQLENNGTIHHQLVTPFFVSTNMAPVEFTFHSPSAKDYVASAIRTIGISGDTCGYWIHEIQKFICQNAPRWVGKCMMRMQIDYLFNDAKFPFFK